MNTALVLTRPDDIFGTHRVRAGAPRALLLGAAAGFCFALQAALTKQLVGEFGGGAGAVVAHLQIYGLGATALIGFVLWQLALTTDVLAPAMTSSNARYPLSLDPPIDRLI